VPKGVKQCEMTLQSSLN